jgi:gliding motility-associated-like protein
LVLKKKKFLYIFLITVWSLFLGDSNLFAQDTSVLGRFSVANATGCAPLTVNITSLDNFGSGTSRQYWYANKDNTPELTTTHTYTTPGEYYLVQLVNVNIPQKEDSIKITVVDPVPPEFTIFNCAGHVVRVELTDTNYDSYRVNFTNSDFEMVAPGTTSREYDFGVAGDYPIVVTGVLNGAADNCGTSNQTITTIDDIVIPAIQAVEVNNESTNGSAFLTYTIGTESTYTLEVSENDAVGFVDWKDITGSNENLLGLNTLNSFYCFRIRTFNACNNQFIYSNIICTTSIDVEVGNGFNKIIWKTEPSLAKSYKILRDGQVENEITELTYEDSNILCGVEYQYEIQSIFDNGTSLSVDTIIVAEKTGDLPMLDLPASNVVDEAIEINWLSPADEVPLLQYRLERSVSGRPFSTIAFILENQYTDERSFFRQNLRYRVVYEDKCENRSIPSGHTSPIILNIKSIKSNVVEFEWNKYETWINGVRTYFLERIDDAGNVTEEFSVLSGRTKAITFSVLDDQPKNIRVRAESLDSTPLSSYSNVRTVEINPILYLPTAFTPDNDGLNDEFIPKGPKVFNFEMQIFSRWGDVIFSSDEPFEGWNGLIKGSKAPEGTYIYRLNFEDAVGNKYDQSGSVIVLRQ